MIQTGYPTLSDRYAWGTNLLLDADSNVPGWTVVTVMTDIYDDINALEIATLSAGALINGFMSAIILWHLYLVAKKQKEKESNQKCSQTTCEAQVNAESSVENTDEDDEGMPDEEINHRLWLGLVFVCTLLTLIVWFVWAQELDTIVENWGEKILLDESYRVQLKVGHQMEMMRFVTYVVQLQYALGEVDLQLIVSSTNLDIYFSTLQVIYPTLSYIYFGSSGSTGTGTASAAGDLVGGSYYSPGNH